MAPCPSMAITELITGLVALALAAFAWSTLKAREAANRAIRSACERAAFLFLDDTVALQSIRLARDAAGHLRFRRTYRFAYSDTGNNRREGSVSLLGDLVTDVDVGAPADGEAARRT